MKSSSIIIRIIILFVIVIIFNYLSCSKVMKVYVFLFPPNAYKALPDDVKEVKKFYHHFGVADDYVIVLKAEMDVSKYKLFVHNIGFTKHDFIASGINIYKQKDNYPFLPKWWDVPNIELQGYYYYDDDIKKYIFYYNGFCYYFESN